MLDTIKEFLNPERLASLGHLAITIIVFMETGLLIGFFLPGDSLLVTAGLLAATKPMGVELNYGLLMVLLIPAAIIGDAVGYWIGRRLGATLFERPDSRLFKRKYLDQTQAFYEKHGSKTIVMARFVPIVRTFAPVIAGVAKMPYRTFALYNILGGVGWVAGMLSLGYFLGNSFPGLAKRIDVLAIVIILISLIPILIEYLRHRRAGATATTAAIETAAGVEAETGK